MGKILFITYGLYKYYLYPFILNLMQNRKDLTKCVMLEMVRRGWHVYV